MIHQMATRQYYFRNPQVLVANRLAASGNATDPAAPHDHTGTRSEAPLAPVDPLAAPSELDSASSPSGTSLSSNKVSAASTLIKGSSLALALVAGLLVVL